MSFLSLISNSSKPSFKHFPLFLSSFILSFYQCYYLLYLPSYFLFLFPHSHVSHVSLSLLHSLSFYLSLPLTYLSNPFFPFSSVSIPTSRLDVLVQKAVDGALDQARGQWYDHIIINK